NVAVAKTSKTKTVLITGAAIRVGRQIALSFADAGWDVAIHYNTSDSKAKELANLVKKKGRKVYLVKANLLDAKEVRNIIPSLTRQKVTLDCLVNNASIF